jgi:hypothetical protein
MVNAQCCPLAEIFGRLPEKMFATTEEFTADIHLCFPQRECKTKYYFALALFLNLSILLFTESTAQALAECLSSRKI